jgi:hypothetical protein
LTAGAGFATVSGAVWAKAADASAVRIAMSNVILIFILFDSFIW